MMGLDLNKHADKKHADKKHADKNDARIDSVPNTLRSGSYWLAHHLIDIDQLS